jgi:hypothetical protein
LGIPISHIEIKPIFFLVLAFSPYFTNVTFRQKKLDKLIFVNKKWPFKPRIGYPKFGNSWEVELILIEELDVEFEHKVEHEETSVIL